MLNKASRVSCRNYIHMYRKKREKQSKYTHTSIHAYWMAHLYSHHWPWPPPLHQWFLASPSFLWGAQVESSTWADPKAPLHRRENKGFLMFRWKLRLLNYNVNAISINSIIKKERDSPWYCAEFSINFMWNIVSWFFLRCIKIRVETINDLISYTN